MARKLILGLIIFFVLIGGIIYAEVEFDVFSFLIFQGQPPFIDNGQPPFIDFNQIPLTAFEKETLENDCFSNDIFFMAGCKYDITNDHRNISLMIVTKPPFNQFASETTVWTLSGDCIGSTFRNASVQVRLIIDFIEGVIDTCNDRIEFDNRDWGLRVIDGIHTFVRIDTGYACTEGTISFFQCADENDDGIFDGGYDELQADCQGILGVDCPLGLTCDFDEEFFFITPAPIESTCVLT